MSKIRLYGNTSGYIELAAPDVSDDATLTLPTGAAGFLAGNGGIGSNVVQATKGDAFTTASSSFTDVTGLTVNITPTTNTSKVLVLVQISYSHSATTQASRFNLVRNSTDLFQSTAGALRNGTLNVGLLDPSTTIHVAPIMFLDSPATTSSTTYHIEAATTGATLYVNRNAAGTNEGSTSSITVIEVAA